jgi:AcrR family transcriptional regulator
MPDAGASAPFHVGLTADRITDAAVELTRASHLYGWSVRDLARRLDVAPSVIYHHIGGKDLVARRVVERVLEELDVPVADGAWRDWFGEALRRLYPVLVAAPGAAKWLLLHGPAFPSVIPIVETGIALLQGAGFAARAPHAYALLFNTAALTISIGDERLLHADDGPRDHATMMAEFQAAAGDRPGVSVLGGALMGPFADGGETAERVREEYYRFAVDTVIAGLTASLAVALTTD